MEKIERKQSVISDEKESGFLAINSLGELLPIIFIAFFFAYLIGSQARVDSTTVVYPEAIENHQASIEKLKESTTLEKQEIVKNEEPQEEKVYINKSPDNTEAKASRIIERPSIQKNIPTETEENIARPLFPKASPREALPTLEVSQPIKELAPTTEKYTLLEEDAADEIILATKPIEEIILSEGTPIIKEQRIETLKSKSIAHLEDVEVEVAEMVVKPNWTPRTMLLEEREEEAVAEELAPEIKEEKQEKSITLSNYNSSDFKWTVNNHSRGIKKSAVFTNTPDGKAAYCRTDAGIVLKINDLANIDPTYGVFVEKSEDGEEYNSIGVINAENAKELFYFDSEYSFDGQHHYRFRSTNIEGEEVEFGKISVIRRASISPVLSQINAAGQYNLVLNSKSIEVVNYEIKEAWGSLNGEKGMKALVEGENSLSFNLTGDPGLYFLTISTENQVLDLLVEKPGISPDLSFYDQDVSGKQYFGGPDTMPFVMEKPTLLNFDFYLKNGNTLIFNEGEYKSETVKIKKAKIGTLPETLQARHSDEVLWFTASSNVSYLHQKVPVILEHDEQEIAAQINIFASKNTIRPISHFSPNKDGIQDNWRIPGIKSCPDIDLLVFNDWGNLVYKTDSVTEDNIWNGEKDGKESPAGMYYYVLGEYGGWVQLERGSI